MEFTARSPSHKFVQEVYTFNAANELSRISALLRSSPPYVCIDTEFPGFLQSPPRDSTEEDFYNAVKFNVDNLKIVQLGITIADGTHLYSWQINFRDFDPSTDPCSESSVAFLKHSGIDFDMNQKHGLSTRETSDMICDTLLEGCHDRKTKWVTFHGIYDFAYLLKLVRQRPLPNTLDEFLHSVWLTFGRIYDIKYMAKCYNELYARYGLLRLAKTMGIDWKGRTHQGGHDSRLTAQLFGEMKKRIEEFDEDNYVGFLYGVDKLVNGLVKRLQDYAEASNYNIFCLYSPAVLAEV